MKFLAEQRTDPTAVYKLLRAYHSKCPPPKLGRAAKGSGSAFNLAQYREEVKTSSSVLNDSVGKMMWRGVFLEHMTGADGGYKSRIASTLQGSMSTKMPVLLLEQRVCFCLWLGLAQLAQPQEVHVHLLLSACLSLTGFKKLPATASGPSSLHCFRQKLTLSSGQSRQTWTVLAKPLLGGVKQKLHGKHLWRM